MSALGGLLREAQSPATRRFLLFAIAAAAIVAVWAIAHQMTAPTYMTLYRDLDLKESGTIGEQLRKSNIAWRLASGGTEIQVPIEQVATARVALARAGLPATGRPGLELFDKASWGMTDFTQRVTYQRALEGELARTIGGLEGIEQAQVHLVLPVSSTLRRLERSASASVVVTLKGGRALSSDAVQGIVYIVSNSVEQLPADNVAVMDATGRVLSVPAAPGEAGGGGSRNLELERTLEAQLGSRIEELLGTVVGTGRVRAQVAATMSFDQVERERESFDPDGQVLQNEQKSEGGASDSGAQSVVNNSYQNSHRLEHSVSATGGVTRLTVAVLVDRTALGGAKNVTTDQLREMARDAAGIDSTRGDRLTLNAVAFEPVTVPDGTPATTSKPAPDLVSMLERVGRPLLAVAAIVSLLVLALRVLKTPARGAEPLAALPPGTAAPVSTGDPAELALLRQRLLAEPGPDATTRVLRAWLADTK
jgi:flagellar M-ring protein FliF